MARVSVKDMNKPTKGVLPMAPASPLTGPVVKRLTEALKRKSLDMGKVERRLYRKHSREFSLGKKSATMAQILLFRPRDLIRLT